MPATVETLMSVCGAGTVFVFQMFLWVYVDFMGLSDTWGSCSWNRNVRAVLCRVFQVHVPWRDHLWFNFCSRNGSLGPRCLLKIHNKMFVQSCCPGHFVCGRTTQSWYIYIHLGAAGNFSLKWTAYTPTSVSLSLLIKTPMYVLKCSAITRTYWRSH